VLPLIIGAFFSLAEALEVEALLVEAEAREVVFDVAVALLAPVLVVVLVSLVPVFLVVVAIIFLVYCDSLGCMPRLHGVRRA
jgi:hypothetical protein